MEKISKQLLVNVSVKQAFDFFIKNFNAWWPRQYSWSAGQLQSISIEAKEGGLCTEIGPYGFRIDWGRVTCYKPPEFFSMKWQISPSRVPEPDPYKSSDLEVSFKEEVGQVRIELVHKNFENHGKGAEEYRKAMDSEYGWGFIIDAYKKALETEESL